MTLEAPMKICSLEALCISAERPRRQQAGLLPTAVKIPKLLHLQQSAVPTEDFVEGVDTSVRSTLIFPAPLVAARSMTSTMPILPAVIQGPLKKLLRRLLFCRLNS